MRRNKKAFQIALCGVLGAAGLMLLMGAGVFPLLDLSLAGAAGLVLIPVLFEFSYRWALLMYFTVGMLGLFLVPNKEPVIIYIFLLGYFPILKFFLDSKVKNKILNVILKLLVVNLGEVVSYYLMISVFHLERVIADCQGMSVALMAATVVLYNITAVVYDVALTKLFILYLRMVRPKIRHMIGR